MTRAAIIVATVVAMFGIESGSASADRGAELAQLRQRFERYSGTKLVFRAADLPKGSYYDRMNELSAKRRIAAARIAVAEIEEYPRGYLGDLGLKTIGVFDSLVSRTGDGFRPYDKRLRGYRYYGLWNGRDALVAGYYSDGQLPLTLHHEIFHHVDGTRAGITHYDNNFRTDDARFRKAVAGKQRYPAPVIGASDLAALKNKREGYVLETTVSGYASKSAGEDQAETARYLMTSLPDALVQMATRPKLAGSQRMLHVLDQYRRAGGARPGVDWFVDVALGRASRANARAFRVAANANYRAMRARIQPSRNDTHFVIWGGEDSAGINWTLRRDLWQLGLSARKLGRDARGIAGTDAALTNAQLRTLRLLARYYGFIAARWNISKGTRGYFELAKDQMIAGLPRSRASLRGRLSKASFAELATSIGAGGTVAGDLIPTALPTNPYSNKVDAAIADKSARMWIRRVQPAAVRFDNGSGVNLVETGLILTAAHVVGKNGANKWVTFPDGRRFRATTIAISKKLDLAILRVNGSVTGLPIAPLAAAPPAVGSWVATIGQPGKYTPSGEPTGYQPFHVSVGKIRGFLPNRLGSQHLGRTMHDAWTYWGHSGSPIFDRFGRIVAMHNSWDSNTAMRHAVTHEAIVHFLKANRVGYAVR